MVRAKTAKIVVGQREERDQIVVGDLARPSDEPDEFRIDRNRTLKQSSTTALRGEGAATFGRDLLERATGGRPSIDPKARPGEHSPVRQVRLPAEVNEQLTALAQAEHRSPSDVIRAALTDYIAAHTAS